MDYYHLLIADPFQDGENVIPEDDFYSKEKPVYQRIGNYNVFKRAIKEPEVVKLWIIDGYAKCGKTVLCHSLIHDFGSIKQFQYHFNEGEGSEYSSAFVIDHLLSAFLTQFIHAKASTIDAFFRLCKKVKSDRNNNRWYIAFEGLLAIEKKCRDIRKSKEEDCAEHLEILFKTVVVRSFDNQKEKTIFDYEDMFQKGLIKPIDVLEIILLSDFILRCALAKEKVEDIENGKINLFCLIDNIDNLSEEAITNLYGALLSTITLLRVYHKNLTDSCYKKMSITYLLPTREVTEEKRKTGVRSISNMPEDLDDFQKVFQISGEMPPIEDIINAKLNYWAVAKKEYLEDEEDDYFEILKIMSIGNPLTELMNGNYSKTLKSLQNMDEEYPKHFKECRRLVEGKNEIEKVAASGIFYRILCEYFRKNSIFDSPCYQKVDDTTNLVKGKLGLFNYSNNEGEMAFPGVSLSRIILTYLSNYNNGCASLKNIFDDILFVEQSDDPEEEIKNKEKICRLIFAMCKGERKTWRRLVLFGKVIPKTVDDLIIQVSGSTKNAEYSDVEICRSGRAYLTYLVPHFEFLSSRIDSIEKMPPLFSDDSIKMGQWRKTIEEVISVVERNAKNDVDYEDMIIDEFGLRPDKAKRFFFKDDRKKDKEKNDRHQQLYLSRLIFSLIGYIERFRQYLFCVRLKKELGYDSALTEPKDIEDNRLLVSFCVRLLALFDGTTLRTGKYSKILDNPCLDKGGFLKFEKKIEGNKYTSTFLLQRLSEADVQNNHNIRDIIEGHEGHKLVYKEMIAGILKIANSDYKLLGEIKGQT